jgi:signal transduction histidine kinase
MTNTVPTTPTSRVESVLFRVGCLLAGIFLPVIVLNDAAHASAVIPGHVVTVWHARDGAPTDISRIAQTADGWMWLGTSSGLYRFDGRRFYAHDIISESEPGPRLVTMLSADTRGGLWVVYGSRAALYLASDGTVTRPQGLPTDGINNVFFDADGRTFASVQGAIYLLEGDRWVAHRAPAWTMPEGDVNDFVVDAEGAAVVLTNSGVFRLARGSTRFVRLDSTAEEEEEFVIASDGKLWRSDGHAVVPVPNERVAKPLGVRESATINVGAGGGLWKQGGGCPTALCYRPGQLTAGAPALQGPDVSAFPRAPDGLLVMCSFVGADGTVWAGGKEGFARIRVSAVTTLRHDGGPVYFAVAKLAGGAMLVGTDAHMGTDHLWQYGSDGIAQSIIGTLPTTTMVSDGSGGALMGGHGSLAHYTDGKLSVDRLPAFLGGELVQQLVPVGADRFWVSVRRHGLYLVDHGKWTLNGEVPGLPHDWPQVAAIDASGRAYFGYSDGRLVVLRADGREVDFNADTGLGTVTAILTGAPLLVGGEHGLAWFDGHSFHRVEVRMGDLLRGVTGIARARNGDVWVNGRQGLLRLKEDDIAATVARNPGPLPIDLVGDAEGMPGGAQQTRPLPTITTDGAGTLWVAAETGLVRVEDDISTGEPRIRPTILSMSTPSQNLPTQAGTLSPGETSLSVSYTGVSPADPDHVEFRYRLAGADDHWRVADGAGTVQYAHLGPGTYAFEIQARGTRGDWSPVVTSGVIERMPGVTETTWFHVFMGALIVLLVAGAYGWRVRAFHRRAAERAMARLAERDRIARELHDSLLQGMLGIALRLQAWRDDERMPGWMTPAVAKVTTQLFALLSEGRARVIALRSVGAIRLPLSEALRLIGEDHAASWPTHFSISVAGQERMLEEEVHLAVIDILREAVHNAFVHAEPNNVSVTLDFLDSGLVALVDDDGKGLPSDVRESGRRPGHWGMVTMRERADRVGARLEITSDEVGTSIALVVHGHGPRAGRSRDET